MLGIGQLLFNLLLKLLNLLLKLLLLLKNLLNSLLQLLLLIVGRGLLGEDGLLKLLKSEKLSLEEKQNQFLREFFSLILPLTLPTYKSWISIEQILMYREYQM